VPTFRQEVAINKIELMQIRGAEEVEQFVEERKLMMKEHLVEHVVMNLMPDQMYSIRYKSTSYDEPCGRHLILRGEIELNPSKTMKLHEYKAVGPVSKHSLVEHVPPPAPPKHDPRAEWSAIRQIDLEE